MKVIDYLNQLGDNEQVTFAIAKAHKDEHTPFYHYEYYQTGIRSVWEWRKVPVMCDRVVLKLDQQPIDSEVWDWQYKQGHLKCCVAASEEDVRKRYPNEEQANWFIHKYED